MCGRQGGHCHFKNVVRVRLFENVRVEQKLHGGARINHDEIWVLSLPGRTNRQCKDERVPALLKEQCADQWAGMEGARERLGGSALREGTRAGSYQALEPIASTQGFPLNKQENSF